MLPNEPPLARAAANTPENAAAACVGLPFSATMFLYGPVSSDLNEVGAKYKNLKIVIPSDANYAAYYDQAVSKYAPDPAAARLWEEYLYSTEGQNLFLEGGTRPIELPSLVSAGTQDKAAYAALPPAPAGGITFPSIAQQNTAETVVSQQWPSVSS